MRVFGIWLLVMTMAGCGSVGPGAGQSARESDLAERYGLSDEDAARAFEWAEVVCDYYEACLGVPVGADCVDSEAESLAVVMFVPDEDAFDLFGVTCDEAEIETQKCLESYREAAAGSCVVDAESCVFVGWRCG